MTVPTYDTQARGGFGPDPRGDRRPAGTHAGDALAAVAAARDLAIAQREALREALAELVDAADTALRDAANGEGEFGYLDSAHQAANRVLLDTPHKLRDPDVRRHIAESFPAKPCGRVDAHPPHVLGTIQDPHQCRGYGGFD